MDNAIRIDNKFNYRINHNQIFVWGIIILYGGWNEFLPVVLRSYISLFLVGIGFLYFVLQVVKGYSSKLNFAVFLITFIFPFIASYQSYNLFGQPIWMGILSLREIWSLFIGYLLFRISSPKYLIRCITRYQLIMIVIGGLCLYVFDIDNSVVQAMLPQQSDVITTGTSENNELRGARFTFGQSYLLICLIYWYCKFLENNKEKKYLWLIAIIIADYLFIHKGRSALVGAFVAMAIPYLRNINIKRLFYFTLICVAILLVVYLIPNLRDRFLVIFDLFGDTRTQGSGDFSGVARLNEILLAIPYIEAHPLFGIGNLSYHFNNGFIGFFQDHFYIGDIGLIGILTVGGINFLLGYIFLFKCITRNVPENRILWKSMVRTLCIYAIISPVWGGNTLWDTPRLAIILIALSLMSRRNYDTYISH